MSDVFHAILRNRHNSLYHAFHIRDYPLYHLYQLKHEMARDVQGLH